MTGSSSASKHLLRFLSSLKMVGERLLSKKKIQGKKLELIHLHLLIRKKKAISVLLPCPFFFLTALLTCYLILNSLFNVQLKLKSLVNIVIRKPQPLNSAFRSHRKPVQTLENEVEKGSTKLFTNEGKSTLLELFR